MNQPGCLGAQRGEIELLVPLDGIGQIGGNISLRPLIEATITLASMKLP